ncbi:MAG: DNA-3-methyladenine glycosylase family protein [Pirellulales bacterium]
MPRAPADRALRRDPVMRGVIDAVGTLREYYRERTDFETVTRIIVGQQLSYAAATTIWKHVVALDPGWRPAAVAALDPERLRAQGLSRSKTRFILEAARRVTEGDLDFRRIRRLDDQAATDTLRGITGFGPWSVEMFMIFGLGRDDIFSVGDAGLRRAVCTLYGIPKTRYERRIGAIADRWRPWRSHACRYLWGWLDVSGP